MTRIYENLPLRYFIEHDFVHWKKVHDGYGNNPADRDLSNPFSRSDRFIRWRHGDGRADVGRSRVHQGLD